MYSYGFDPDTHSLFKCFLFQADGDVNANVEGYGNRGRGGLRRITQAGDRGGGAAGGVLPYPRMSDTPRRCKYCLEAVMGQGYTQARKKIGQVTQQCQKCQDPLCKNHLIVICQGCAASITNVNNNNDDDFEED